MVIEASAPVSERNRDSVESINQTPEKETLQSPHAIGDVEIERELLQR
jgi:hypothetical protein